MNSIDRLQLNKMIQANNVEDCTDNIRNKKHSDKIKTDVEINKPKNEYSELLKSNQEDFDTMAVLQCNFLFNNYTDIYNKVKKDEVNLETLWKFLDILKRIEDGEIDQHTASYEVGNILKKLYIDSALLKADKIDKQTGEKIPSEPEREIKKISWLEYKNSVKNKN